MTVSLITTVNNVSSGYLYPIRPSIAKHGKGFDFITSHDGSTLFGLVSTNEEQNNVNGERKCFASVLTNTSQITVNDHQQNDTHLIIFNSHNHCINFLSPELNGYWQVFIDTTLEITENILHNTKEKFPYDE